MTESPTLDDRLNAVLGRSAYLAPLAVAGGAVALGLVRGPGAAVLALAGGALLGAIAGLWNSLRVLSGDAPLTLHEAIDLGSPTSLDEQKRAILRALKDLQQEHALGKITDEDFRELSARYRAEAKVLLREMDEALAPARQQAESLLAARLAGKLDDDEEPEAPRPKKGTDGKKAADASKAGEASPKKARKKPRPAAPEASTAQAEPPAASEPDEAPGSPAAASAAPEPDEGQERGGAPAERERIGVGKGEA